MCRARSRKIRGEGANFPSKTPQEAHYTPASNDVVPETELWLGKTSSTEPPASTPVVATDSSSAVLIGSCFFLVLGLLAVMYWMYRMELRRTNVRLPTSRFVLTRRKLDNSTEQTPFRGVFGAQPRSSKYDSIPDEPDVLEPKVSFEATIPEHKIGGLDYLQLPSCSQSDLSRAPDQSLSTLTRKRQQREEKIQNRNVLFEKLLSGEEELEVFVVHEERC